VTVLIDDLAKRVIVYQEEQKQRALLIPGGYQIVSNYPGNRIVFRETGQVRGGTITLLQGEKLLGKIVVHVASGHPKVELVQ
jgi:competence protein ComGD